MRSDFLLMTGCTSFLLFASCGAKNDTPPQILIKDMNLKRGELISCGPTDKQFGLLAFEITGKEEVKEDFRLALKLLHSFEYDEAEKVFAGILDKDPKCAMAYWGIAMSNFHALWAPPTEAELQKGARAIIIANSIAQKTEREKGYIAAIDVFY
ncbi:MAG TPA: hypothetical protein VF609_06770 [Flavisolibacter sp.]